MNMPSPPWARYRVGDTMGPFVVESVELEWVDGSTWMEKVVNSGRVVHQMVRRVPEKPKLFYPPEIDSEMRIVIPYVPHYDSGRAIQEERNPETVASAPPNAEWVNVEGSDWNYWSLLCTLWDPRHSLMLIEHDVTCRPDIVTAYESCSEPWCMTNYHAFSDEDAAAWHWGILGCTRFSAELMAKTSTLMTGMSPGMRHWTELSTGVGQALRELGYAPHEHFPRVIHHQDRPWGVSAANDNS